MKKTFIFIMLLLLCASCSILKNREQSLVTAGSWTIRPGDTVKLGKGSQPDGSFKYVKNAGWQTAVKVESSDVAVKADQTIVDKSYNYKQVVVSSIKGNNTLVINTAVGGRIHVKVEEAIAAGELLAPK